MRDPDQQVGHPRRDCSALSSQPRSERLQGLTKIEKQLCRFDVISGRPFEMLAFVCELFFNLIGQMGIDQHQALIAELSIKERSCEADGPEIEEQVIAAQVPLEVIGQECHLPGERYEKRCRRAFSLSPLRGCLARGF